jgi:spermidine synthase
MAVQATSPLFARRSFWCIVATLRAAGFHVHPYHTPVPSFGVWGFALARLEPFAPPVRAPVGLGLRYLDDGALAGLFRFPADMAPLEVEINRLDDQMLVRYYEGEWRRWED